jgi:hypothetical protein
MCALVRSRLRRNPDVTGAVRSPCFRVSNAVRKRQALRRGRARGDSARAVHLPSRPSTSTESASHDPSVFPLTRRGVVRVRSPVMPSGPHDLAGGSPGEPPAANLTLRSMTARARSPTEQPTRSARFSRRKIAVSIVQPICVEIIPAACATRTVRVGAHGTRFSAGGTSPLSSSPVRCSEDRDAAPTSRDHGRRT